jgi:hypothetical protein
MSKSPWGDDNNDNITDIFEKMKRGSGKMPDFKMPDMASISSNTSAPSSSVNDQNTITTDLTKGIDQLNMRMERLIAAVEDGADKNVKAVRSKGNILA